MSSLSVEAQESADYIISRIGSSYRTPVAVIICGSGLSTLAAVFEKTFEISYRDIPHFETSTVAGHASKLVFGTLNEKPVLAMVGRFHFYEGYTIKKTTFPIRTFSRMEIKVMIATNAAGGLNEKYQVIRKPGARGGTSLILGDLVVLSDHINLPGLVGQNPLMGPNEETFGERFTPLSDAYDLDLRQRFFRSYKQLGPKRGLYEGTYCFVSGPFYETRAECVMLHRLGADLVGMSTVAEVITARHSGMRVLAVSLVTNKSILTPTPSGQDSNIDEKMMTSGIANHEEVLEAGLQAATDLRTLIVNLIDQL